MTDLRIGKKTSPSNKEKEQGQAQQKVQGLKPSISTSKPHVENLNNSRESQKKQELTRS